MQVTETTRVSTATKPHYVGERCTARGKGGTECCGACGGRAEALLLILVGNDSTSGVMDSLNRERERERGRELKGSKLRCNALRASPPFFNVASVTSCTANTP